MKEEHYNKGRRRDDFIVVDSGIVKHSFWNTLALRLVTWTLTIFAVITLGYAYQEYEADIFPVVEDFRVETLSNTQDGIEIHGNMVKSRECQFEDVSVYTKGVDEEYANLVDIVFGDKTDSTRAPIPQNFGPWYITIPQDFSNLTIEIYATHNCNFFYQTTSMISSFNIKKDYGGIVLVTRGI